eukprot:c7838_g1_i1.p1 GENE.c7838_g1_i1~~c7838_g1_i1.p1  ORF type:complete len:114 (-),score=21.54 c7838_g1_i1:181-489(-)
MQDTTSETFGLNTWFDNEQLTQLVHETSRMYQQQFQKNGITQAQHWLEHSDIMASGTFSVHKSRHQGIITATTAVQDCFALLNRLNDISVCLHTNFHHILPI